ncbi:glycosyltransferase family 4 protein [Leeuwenhoekiella polynyae]|uniref:Glycosyltransferase involved in cell wall biosynthesis n=1 Tax=Leeuwenhoekiella polynyae TaxID=1550906 RepID=A0A4Q0NTJ0_9FLAO|nr:glycosyltransferase family 4 protein [Leeuwenhoekiella polynyae]RXG14683.1 glycosyltransferase involved in cell wall biosynthesis [Leeuwenhoekiella polynyae]
MKVALVQDWLTEMGGAEQVFKAIYQLYPQADVYTLVYTPQILEKLDIPAEQVTASFIQKFPFAKTQYRNYLPFFSLAIESFDLSEYNLIISSSYAVAKGVMTNSKQLHICYCHSPVRYAWDLHHQYIAEAGLQNGIKGFVVKYFLHKLRIWDVIASNRVDHFIGNSNYIGKRIEKVYRRSAETIYPPVAFQDFEFQAEKEDFYFTCSRLVPYKKIDLIVAAFKELPDKRLVVIGDGPDMGKIKKLAGTNVKILGYQPFSVLKDHMKRAKAFVFAAEEDFGIVPLEAQACGTPVIAYGKGGALETVVDGKTGMYFKEQTPAALIDAVARFEGGGFQFDPAVIRKHAESFEVAEFKNKLSQFVRSKYAAFYNESLRTSNT